MASGSEEMYRWRPNDRTDSVLRQMTQQGDLFRQQESERGAMGAEDKLNRAEMLSNLPGQVIQQYRQGKDYARKEDLEKQQYKQAEEAYKGTQLQNAGQGLQNEGQGIRNQGSQLELGHAQRTDKMMQGIDPKTGESLELSSMANPIRQQSIATRGMQRESDWGQGKSAKPGVSNEQLGWQTGQRSKELANNATAQNTATQAALLPGQVGSQNLANKQGEFNYNTGMQDDRLIRGTQVAQSAGEDPKLVSATLAAQGYGKAEIPIIMNMARQAKAAGQSGSDFAYANSTQRGRAVIAEVSQLSNKITATKKIEDLYTAYKNASKAERMGPYSAAATDTARQIDEELGKIGGKEDLQAELKNSGGMFGTTSGTIEKAIQQLHREVGPALDSAEQSYANEPSSEVKAILTTARGKINGGNQGTQGPLNLIGGQQPNYQTVNANYLSGQGQQQQPMPQQQGMQYAPQGPATNGQGGFQPQGQQFAPQGPQSEGIQPAYAPTQINLRGRAKTPQMPATGAPR